MKLLKRNIIAVVMSMLVCNIIHAQGFSLDEAIAIAKDSVYTVMADKYGLKAADARYLEMLALRKPQLKLNISPYYSKYVVDPTRDYLYERNYDMLGAVADLSLTQQILRWGGEAYASSQFSWAEYFHGSNRNGYARQFAATPIRVGYRQDLLGYNDYLWQQRELKHAQLLAQQKLQHKLMTVAEETTRLFFSVTASQIHMDICEAAARTSKFLYEVAVERNKIAMVGKIELNTLRLRSLNDDAELTAARHNLQCEREAFASYLHIVNPDSISLRLPDALPNEDYTVEQAIDMALSHHPDLLAMQQEQIYAQHKRAQAKREVGFKAKLDVSVGVNQLNTSFGDVYTDQKFQGIGLVSISIPLIDHGAARQHQKVAEMELSRASKNVQEAQRVISEEVILTVLKLNEAKLKYLGQLETLEMARSLFAEASDSYANSIIDINTYSLAQTEYLKASANFIDTMMQYWTSYYHLRSLVLN